MGQAVGHELLASDRGRRPRQTFGDVRAVDGVDLVVPRGVVYLFGGAVAGSTGACLQYLLPGLLVLTKGVVDRFRSLPVWRLAPLLGAALGERFTLAPTLVVVVGPARS